MITSTVGDLADGRLDDLDTRGHRLYLVRDGETVLYVGQSRDPIDRLFGHFGYGTWGMRGPSRLGQLIMANLPEARAWVIDILTPADCEPIMQASRPGIYEWYARAVHPELLPIVERWIKEKSPPVVPYTAEDAAQYQAEAESLETAVNCAEKALIDHYGPALNISGNYHPRPLPEHYRGVIIEDGHSTAILDRLGV